MFNIEELNHVNMDYCDRVLCIEELKQYLDY
jgi:hypothetical protein